MEQTSSTGRGAADNSPTLGCFGLAPSRLSKQWGMGHLPIFLLRLGSSHLMWIASLASLVNWEGSLSIMLKSSMEGRGWWKSLQCFSMADVVDLECSLTLSPRALEVSLQYMRSYIHLPYTPSGRLDPSFGHWRSCPLGCISMDFRVLTPLKHLVLACTWRFSWRIHSILEIRYWDVETFLYLIPCLRMN